MKKVVLVLAAVIALSAVPASAGAIAVDAGWYGFCFDATPGAAVYAGCLGGASDTAGNPFTFSTLYPVLFKVTDAFLYGDIFSIEINGGPPFLTSPAVAGGGTTSNPDAAFADLKYSKFKMLLLPGDYSIDVFYSSGTGITGAGYLEVESVAVPDAGSAFTLLGLGMMGLATLRRTHLK